MASIKFRINKQVSYGQAIYLLCSENKWIASSNSRMTCIKSNIWVFQTVISSPTIEYKYAIGNFDNPQQNQLVWEKGQNRQFNVEESQHKIKKDYWEQRSIVIMLNQEITESIAIMMGNIDELKGPRVMKKKSFNEIKWFYLKLFIDNARIQDTISIQYYLLVYGKEPKEFISKPIIIDQHSKKTEEIEFTQVYVV